MLGYRRPEGKFYPTDSYLVFGPGSREKFDALMGTVLDTCDGLCSDLKYGKCENSKGLIFNYRGFNFKVHNAYAACAAR